MKKKNFDKTCSNASVSKSIEPPKISQTNRDKDPVRLTLFDDIKKEADRQHTNQENKNLQLSNKEQHKLQIYCISTISDQHAVYIHNTACAK